MAARTEADIRLGAMKPVGVRRLGVTQQEDAGLSLHLAPRVKNMDHITEWAAGCPAVVLPSPNRGTAPPVVRNPEPPTTMRVRMADVRNKYRTILLFGMPGSGKGTQGAVLGQLPDLVHVSMGDVFRKIPKYGKFGQEIERYTSKGALVPDDLTVRIWERHIQILGWQELLLPGQHTLILDGVPRNYAQAERLDHVLDVIQIFHLHINDEVRAGERLKARALRENRLDDMNEEVIRRRLKTYYDETYKTLSFYPPELVFDIDAGQSPIDVLRDIVCRMSDLQQLVTSRPSAISETAHSS
jgi:adenylate kinase